MLSVRYNLTFETLLGAILEVKSRRHGLDARLVHVGFVLEKGALEQVFFRVLRFSPSVLFHHCSILIFIYAFLLPEGETGDAWDSFPRIDSDVCVHSRHDLNELHTQQVYCFSIFNILTSYFYKLLLCLLHVLKV
jgi:hypothetical protein